MAIYQSLDSVFSNFHEQVGKERIKKMLVYLIKRQNDLIKSFQGLKAYNKEEQQEIEKTIEAAKTYINDIENHEHIINLLRKKKIIPPEGTNWFFVCSVGTIILLAILILKNS